MPDVQVSPAPRNAVENVCFTEVLVHEFLMHEFLVEM
jgi:hypothetical protein